MASGGDGVLVLPAMRDVGGRFLFDNGTVKMEGVRFTFQQAPVTFASGLGHALATMASSTSRSAKRLLVRNLRLDAELRQVMPPDGRVRPPPGPREIASPPAATWASSWSGGAAEPAVCIWKNAKVFFLDNTIQAGLPICHLQGEVRYVSGRSDGRTIAAQGFVDLDSVALGDLQIPPVHDAGRDRRGQGDAEGPPGDLAGTPRSAASAR